MLSTKFKVFSSLIFGILLCFLAKAHHDQDKHDHDDHIHSEESDHNHANPPTEKTHIGDIDKHHAEDHHSDEAHENSCGFHQEDHAEFDPGALAFHHISDQNVYNIGPLQLPLPCIMWVPGQGINVFSSGKFKADYHGNGSIVYKKYILKEGLIMRVPDFPTDEIVNINQHDVVTTKVKVDGKDKSTTHLCFEGNKYVCDNRSTLDGGLFEGGLTSFHDLSITKNVFSMILVALLLAWLFISVARTYKRRQGMAPQGAQGLIEPIFVFIQDEVAKPFLGNKWEKFLPLLMTLFFFILGLNLWGQIPFLGGSNVTGSLSVTLVMAVVVFLVTNFNGNKHYWKHIFWMPGVPSWVKTIITPIELLGLFIKPVTLMLRLFANITAGHMVIVIFVSLIFVFGRSGESVIGGYATVIPSALLTVFMMSIELLVAFIQAFVFTILTASYIGAATEEHHH